MSAITGKEGPSLLPDQVTKKVVVPIGVSARRWPHLVGIGGEVVGLGFRLVEDETIIGREPGSHIRLSSATVSRRHAIVRVIGDEVTIEDLGSRNGTFVDMDRVKEPRVLRDGDHIAVGDSTLLKLAYGTDAESAIMRAGYETASRDPETTASNRFLLGDLLSRELAYAKRHGSSVALVFFHVDGAGGPASATDSLRYLATTLRKAMRANEPLGRLNGDLVALLRAAQEEASAMADRIRREVSTPPDHTDGGADATLVVTAAVVPLIVLDQFDAESLLAIAHERARDVFVRGTGRVTIAAVADSDGSPHAGTP